MYTLHQQEKAKKQQQKQKQDDTANSETDSRTAVTSAKLVTVSDAQRSGLADAIKDLTFMDKNAKELVFVITLYMMLSHAFGFLYGSSFITSPNL